MSNFVLGGYGLSLKIDAGGMIKRIVATGAPIEGEKEENVCQGEANMIYIKID